MEYSTGTDGNDAPSDLVGFPPRHSRIFLDVARGRDEIIMARALGLQCRGLIEEGYGLKGFRIDTKSCDWGPMAGFVCMDPRLRKPPRAKERDWQKKWKEEEEFNRTQTRQAITGEVTNLGGVALDTRRAVVRGEARTTEWAASVKPIVISQARVDWLQSQGLIDKGTDGSLAGVSVCPCPEHPNVVSPPQGNGCRYCIWLPWRLIALTEADLRDDSIRPVELRPGQTYYGLFVDKTSSLQFDQEYAHGVEPFSYADDKKDHVPVLGLINPATKRFGFKACVTGDYDLFAVWPRESDFRSKKSFRFASLGETFQGVPGRRFDKDERQLGKNPLAWADLARFQRERRGNVTPRIERLVGELNDRLKAEFNNPGDLVHHSDEVGNPGGLAKPLFDCLPIIAFLPSSPSVISGDPRVTGGGIFGLGDMNDLKEFARLAQGASFHLDLKPGWWRDLDLTPDGPANHGDALSSPTACNRSLVASLKARLGYAS